MGSFAFIRIQLVFSSFGKVVGGGMAIFFLLGIGNSAHAQQDDAEGNVVFHSDPRLAVLVRKNHSYVRLTTPEPKPPEPPKPAVNTANSFVGPGGLVHHEQRTNYTGKGYRVQIYNGPDRNKAIAIKTEFMRQHPGVSTYLTYVAPGFRVKIGDYKNRSDAEGMLREANSISSSPSMIVPDIVTISSY